MKLPNLHITNIKKIKTIQNKFTNNERKNNLLNYFLLPNNNISSLLTENKNKWDIINQEFRKTQRYLSHINRLREKKKSFTNTKRVFYHYRNNNYLNSFYKTSSKRKHTNNVHHKTEDAQDNANNYEKYENYIKNTLNSFKIKKEISSYLYSSREKQERFINYLNFKFNKINNITKKNNHKSKIESKKKMKIKVFRRIIESDYNNKLNVGNGEDKDEDKTNFKEFALFTSNQEDKNESLPIKIIKYMKNNNNNKKFIECWDNNLLKNILPRNIKSQSKLNSNDKHLPVSEFNMMNLNSLNNNINKPKYKYINSNNSSDINRVLTNIIHKRNENYYYKRLNRNSTNS